MASGIALAGLSVVTVAFGGNDGKTYGWAAAFLDVAAANLAFGSWELSMTRPAIAPGQAS